MQDGVIMRIMTDMDVASELLLKVIRFKCKACDDLDHDQDLGTVNSHKIK